MVTQFVFNTPFKLVEHFQEKETNDKIIRGTIPAYIVIYMYALYAYLSRLKDRQTLQEKYAPCSHAVMLRNIYYGEKHISNSVIFHI